MVLKSSAPNQLSALISNVHKRPKRQVTHESCVVSVADPMKNVTWILFPGETEPGTHVKTASRADRTHSQ